MKNESKIIIAILYSQGLASVSAYFSAAIVSNMITGHTPFFLISFSILSLLPFLYVKKINPRYLLIFSFLTFLLSLGIMVVSHEYIDLSGDVMDAFILLLISILLFASLRDSINLLYSGLSFYLVGIGLLISYSALKIIILLADVFDYYINCIGESCAPYTTGVIPAIVLILLTFPALIPYWHRDLFRREAYDS